jgi:hypothetical protein
MRNLLVSCLFLLLVSFAAAQSYRPFYGGENQTFRYLMEGTNISSVQHFHTRIDSVGTMAGDSVWFFPMLARKIPNSSSYLLDNESDLGAFVVERASGVFEFHSLETGDTIFIETQLPLNASWTFRSNASITAEITSRTLGTVFGSTTDSILVISLSDGKEILLSQNYGMVEYPRLSTYFRNDPYLKFTLLEQARIPTIRDYYSWNVGDSLGEKDRNTDFQGGTLEWHGEVISAIVSPGGNSLQFELDITGRYSPNSSSSTTTYTHFVHQRTYNSSNLPELLLGTLEYHDYLSSGRVDVVASDYPDSSFHGLATRTVSGLDRNANIAELNCSLSLNDVDYARKLGKVEITQLAGWCSDTQDARYWDLACYKVGGLSNLPCPYIGQPVSATDQVEEGQLKVFPNPSNGDFVIEWENLASKGMTLQIHDLSGRLVWDRPVRKGNSGSIQVESGLPAGIYLLSVNESSGKVLRKKVVIQ